MLQLLVPALFRAYAARAVGCGAHSAREPSGARCPVGTWFRRAGYVCGSSAYAGRVCLVCVPQSGALRPAERGQLPSHVWGTQVWVNALSNTSDTNVDRKRVDGKILLKDNDLIEIGQRQFIFHSLHPDAAPGSAKVPLHVPHHCAPRPLRPEAPTLCAVGPRRDQQRQSDGSGAESSGRGVGSDTRRRAMLAD